MDIPSEKIDIQDLDPAQLADWLKSRQLEPYRARQILRWIYGRQVDSFDLMTDLKKEIRLLLSNTFSLNRLQILKTETSADGSRKYLFRLRDGHCIESVLIPERDHFTLCISSQVGCAQGCRFCLTGRGGLKRNLTRGEIVSQVRDVLFDLPAARPLTNIVLMGMGEPLANYDAVLGAVDSLTDGESGLGFAGRRVTISTAGLVPRLRTLGQDTGANLAVSLNATDNATRDMLMPINRRYPIEVLLAVCRQYPLAPHRRITFEYVLIRGINDTPADAERLARLLQPIRAKVNLIPFNRHEGSDFESPLEPAILKFQEILLRKNYTVIIRRSKGRDISAACGQLGARERMNIEPSTFDLEC